MVAVSTMMKPALCAGVMSAMVAFTAKLRSTSVRVIPVCMVGHVRI